MIDTKNLTSISGLGGMERELRRRLTSSPSSDVSESILNNFGAGGKSTSEKDPEGRDPHTPGAKLDGGKAPIFQGVINYFPRAIREVGRVSGFGASKYVWKGWETVPDGINRYSDAMVRHLAKEGEGEILDPDSGLLHAAHTAWGALARLELMLREKDGRT